jgi:ribonuclease HII
MAAILTGPVAGVDEVGRGPLAGPVVVAAMILRRPLAGLADSKQLSEARRRELDAAIRANAQVALAAASVAEIERFNILGATMLAMRRAVLRLGVRPCLVLVDGNRAPRLDLPVRCVVGGDATVPEISAASIVAKVARDRLMARLGERYPGYGFERNAGYWRPEHVVAIRKLGPTPEHRLSFNVRGSAEAVAAPAPARRRAQRSAPWRELPAQEKAAHLLEKITIADRAWTDEPRRQRETRSAYIRRVLLGETESTEGP